ncbi:hypothetical protein [Thermoanaerobacter sp. A7A]|uniref:hypothetical protein n=1 Tax=Thermoanaerobacter sp. A7A TaxID=1350366 RepID=UPI000414158E|nr:hypothetical protein [Thermoanaerobacter sp. A7A]
MSNLKMKKIVNFTQHHPTPEQGKAGVYNPAEWEKIKELLTFDELPSREEVFARARQLTEIALAEHERTGAVEVMIGGAPFFMPALYHALLSKGLIPVFAFSRRVSVEKKNPDGTVTKTQVFKHEGFVRF